MAEFLIMIVILAVCGLLFGKADTKKQILNTVGLDLKQDNYDSKKRSEFRNYAIKAMKKIVDLDGYNAQDEKQFLRFMSDNLSYAIWGREVKTGFGYYDTQTEYLNINVKTHYIKHGYRVISRRLDDVKKGNDTPLSTTIDFSNKSQAKRYCELLWDKYQYPWPDDWLKEDGI